MTGRMMGTTPDTPRAIGCEHRWENDHIMPPRCYHCGLTTLNVIAALRHEMKQILDWEDVKDQWSEAIKAAHPTRNNVHDYWATAMTMVGHRHSKYALVELVNWLLLEMKIGGTRP